MRARYFGVLLLFAVGVAPLVIAGLFMSNRAERTALAAIERGNRLVAERAAKRLGAYVGSELQAIEMLAAPLATSLSLAPRQAERLLKNYRLMLPHLRALDVLGNDCHETATSRLDGVTKTRCGEAAVDAALAGTAYRGQVKLSDDFAPAMTIGVPLKIAGEDVGAAVAEVDLVGMWPAVDEIVVGQEGYARLVGKDGVLIAHGDPEERRAVFQRKTDAFAAQVASAKGAGVRYKNSQGTDVLAVAAFVPELGWTLIVEQPVAEAFAASSLMRRDLAIIVAFAALLALAVGLFVGTKQVRTLEAMRVHANKVGQGDLDARVPLPRMVELRSLAEAMNELPAELQKLHEQIRSQERLTAFAQVSAGLAHDLQVPIDAVRSSCEHAVSANSLPEAVDALRRATDVHLPRLASFVRDLRRLAKQGSLPLELDKIDPRKLAEQVFAEAKANLKWEGIEFAVSGDAHEILADSSLLQRAIGNLVSNAADACAEAGEHGTVTIAVENADNEAVLFSVADSGVGIAPERLDDLFRHQFKSHKHSTGVGLGLGVTKHVADAHGGHLAAESKRGEGSTFILTMPVRPPHEARSEEAE